MPEGSDWGSGVEAVTGLGEASADTEADSGTREASADVIVSGKEAAGESVGDAPEGPEKEPKAKVDMDAALEQIPEALRREMAEVLRAEFREVRPYKPRGK